LSGRRDKSIAPMMASMRLSKRAYASGSTVGPERGEIKGADRVMHISEFIDAHNGRPVVVVDRL
jgi:hypothetical protein